MANSGREKNNKTVKLKPFKARRYNKTSDKAAYVIPYGGTPDDPEYLYPEELEASIVTASLDESRRLRAEKEAGKFRDRSLKGYIGLASTLNQGDTSLQNIAGTAIGVPLLATNPAVMEPLVKSALHTGKVMLDPTKALTGVGQSVATTADVYGTVAGLQQVPQATRNIISGQGTSKDWFNLITGAMGPFGTFNTIKGIKNMNAHRLFNVPNYHVDDLTYREPVHPHDQINSITQTPEGIYKEISVAEVPESAFIGTRNPLVDIQLSPTSVSKQREKFVRDVNQAVKFQRTSSQTKPETLIEFVGETPYGTLPFGTSIGIGMENVVYDLGDEVIKIPTINEQRMIRNAAGEAVWEYGFGKESLDEMITDAETYLTNFNKYWFQEPLSLKGYQRRIRRDGKTVYVPVYSQHKASSTYGQALRDAVNTGNTETMKKLIDEKSELDVLKESNIFRENDLPEPFDMHSENFAVYPWGIRAIDVHKNGGNLYKKSLNKFYGLGTIINPDLA